MEERIKLKIMLYFMIAYLAFFTLLSVINKDYEFLYYTFILSVLIIFLVLYYKKFHLHSGVIGGLTLLGVLHILGGNLHIGGVRLYDIWFIQDILKYDNIVHFFGIFVATLVAFNLLSHHLDKEILHNRFMLALILVLIAMGMGALNEVFELDAVVFFGAQQAVGDYMNNALDLLFNLLGGITASVYLIEFKKVVKVKK